MICASCDGLVIWKGPLTQPTHTECLRCGAINSQVVEQPEDDSCGDELNEEARNV